LMHPYSCRMLSERDGHDETDAVAGKDADKLTRPAVDIEIETE
jgi:hypothetical protein